MLDPAATSRSEAQDAIQERYSRQIRFAPIGWKGQRRIGQAVVLVAGTGSLGASLAQHMARAGVGELRLADRDYVEFSNLQRQMLFDEEDARLALPKAEAAARKLRRINGIIELEAFAADFTAPGLLEKIAGGCDLVLDGTDNAAARLVLSDYCFRAGIPFLYGGVAGAAGMSAPLIPGATCCLRCLIGGEEEQESGQTCETAGMISPAVEMVAALQAAEALKWLAGDREGMRRTLVSASVWPYAMRETKLPGPSRLCSICGCAGAVQERSGGGTRSGTQDAWREDEEAESLWGTGREFLPKAASEAAGSSRRQHAAVLCGRDTFQLQLEPAEPGTYEKRLERLGCRLTLNPYLLRAVLPDNGKLVVFPDGRVLAQGAADADTAWEWCRHYLGAEAPEREAKDEEA
ncbi:MULTISPECIES: ThiF family adenylyltransferase [unclassified Paenibacillus]|uniref:ThiF family adenylyltransferase n=1 Tax=unclassified Paenibacillus TaxID=185978 RepID=UPI0009571B05|nr:MULTISPECIES: ThiF family adenylyltransferase [unclassified Paenibacillus]ASS68972.1 thiamine biosynthesis protein ThiF [Paenibacillus sp. RUD330]SIR12701.1 adenylyltransferase and sulfurtransferase [Paenibacillus sp. RU4X]SIR24725.1 adenylyltransferase and sulfurtransferase [Paenibacillus sp. RU4T]